MTIGTPRRGRTASQVFDPSDWRKLFADDRAWVVAARVDTHEGEATHFVVDVDAVGVRTVFVDVVTVPGDVELRCKIGTLPVIIPAVGTEVLVSIPDGRIDFIPAIVGYVTPLGATSGVDATHGVLVVPNGMKLLVHDGDSGEAHKLPTMADFDALRKHVDSQFDANVGHRHGVSGALTTVITTVAALPVPAPTVPTPTPAGTQTLEVK